MSDREIHRPEGVCKPAEPYSQAVSASGREGGRLESVMA